MNIRNDYSWRATSSKRENSPLLPQNIRGLIVGKSNCGKTTLLLNLLLQPDWLDYNHLYVFGKSLHQQEYRVLKKGLEAGLSKRQVSNLFLQQDILARANLPPLEAIDEYNGIKEGGIKVNFYDDCCQIPDPAELNPSEKNLLILDDCFLGKQNKAEAYYTRGRHNNCDTLYISQNYFRLPRQTVRENANFIILFPQDARNLNHIYADHCSSDGISREEFKEFCHKVWTSGKHDRLNESKNEWKVPKELRLFLFSILISITVCLLV